MDTIKKIVEIVVVILFVSTANAQTGIGTTTPHASAKLDVTATNKGFLPPRVTLSSNTDATTIPSPAEGLLVYNTGNNSGLVAGYYYWNGANWATIATAIAAGYGVAASEMQKIYDGVGNATTINSTGVTFTVPTSGTYLFDFSCSGTNNNGTLTMNFYVRDGSTVLKSDMQTSYSNNVHAEYNGKVEVNLVIGKTYNVLVNTSSGGIYSSDYCRVYMKQMSGNLPINQHMANRNFQLNNNYLSNDGDNEGIRIDNSGNVGIGNNAPTAKLDVTGSFGVSGSATFRTTGGDEGGEIEFGIPQTNTTLSTRVVADVWQNRFRIFDGNTKGVYIDLSKAPTGVGGELLTKASGFVNAGDYVTLGNIRARIPTSGNRSLQVATVSGTYSVYGSGVHVFSSNVGSTTIDGGSPRTITTTPVYLNPGNTFATAGGTDTWNIMDTTNFIAWRISCIIGGGYFANLITIERLF